MPALSAQVRAELDALDADAALEAMVDYYAERRQLFDVGQRKLIAIFDDGRLRKVHVEFAMGRDSFQHAADHG